ncbi:peptidase C39-like protein [Kribbella amoyensis]|uniref:Peptidase C39-like protein n=1 Tax=Kribbella amoyensis TaxID=996641 RepID=A0A561BRT6_9ACTN|nr:peptidase C39 family protein [Kribbella amoyensis]TWD81591.1 peptidase C39-like protein [Kribbella amoyensis]
MTAFRPLATLVSGVAVLSLATVPSEATKVPLQRDIAYQDWTSTADFLAGDHAGTTVADGTLTFGTTEATTAYVDPFGDGTAKTYDRTSWTSPEVRPGFGLTELVASWNATTPPGTWVEVAMAGRTDQGTATKWYVLGRWSGGDDTAAGDIHRTSVPSQGDANGSVAVDTFVAETGRTLDRWQLKVTLYRLAGTTSAPSVRSVGAMASRLPDLKKIPASPSGGAEGVVLDVPTYSQETHIGHYPQWDNGGEAWCSATSSAMVLDYYGAGPSDGETAWVDPADADPQVDHSARSVFDYAYDGAGNWPFNTAYAGTRGVDAFVTRLRSLTEAEQFIKAGIPLIASLSFKKGDLPGAGYGTNGHLMVIVGFDEAGNVVVNDPASHLIASNDEVRTTYDRKAFENAWVPHSGGLVYVVHPKDGPLPPAPAQANW